MGCTSSTGVYGPIATTDLESLRERDSDIDILDESEFPYMSGRLKDLNYKKIIKEGKPWKDPCFPHGKYCLFINHQTPQKEHAESKAKWVRDFHWKRAGTFFKDQGKKMSIFDGVDPSDVIMGSCNNCYAFAALAGIAEALDSEDRMQEKDKGERIRSRFLTSKVNAAGCYAIKFVIDGQPRTIVIDDYFPFIKTKGGQEIFAFAKSKIDENEIWVQLVEKAWAKLCGSYEASEMGRTSEFFQNFLGTPTDPIWTDDYESADKMIELYKKMAEADTNNWIMCASILKSMKSATKDAPIGVLQTVGLKNCHAYTLIDVREILLDDGTQEHMIFLRNPTGNIFNKRNEIWNGDYGPWSDKWTPKVRKQCNYWATPAQIQEGMAKGRIEMGNNGLRRGVKRNDPLGQSPLGKQRPGSGKSRMTAKSGKKSQLSQLNLDSDSDPVSGSDASDSEADEASDIETKKRPKKKVQVDSEEESEEEKPRKKSSKKKKKKDDSDEDDSDEEEGGEKEQTWILVDLNDEEQSSTEQFEGGKKKKKRQETESEEESKEEASEDSEENLKVRKKSSKSKKKQDTSEEWSGSDDPIPFKKTIIKKLDESLYDNSDEDESQIETSSRRKPKRRGGKGDDDDVVSVKSMKSMISNKSAFKKLSKQERNKRAAILAKNDAKQHNDYSKSNAKGSTYWISLKDFIKYFYLLTISYNDQAHVPSFCSDQVFSYKWGACQFEIKASEKNCFFTLYQMNDRFMGEGDGGAEDFEYAQMQMIICKVIKIPPKDGKMENVQGECAYIDGNIGDLYNNINVKVDSMTAGTYVAFYTANFAPDQLCRRLNTIFLSQHEVTMKRISARRFGKEFLMDLERRNMKKQGDDNYKQPVF